MVVRQTRIHDLGEHGLAPQFVASTDRRRKSVAKPGRMEFSRHLCIAARLRKVAAENPDLWTARVTAYKVDEDYVHR
jgi:hypothetical protein